jgi:hypothetical protein
MSKAGYAELAELLKPDEVDQEIVAVLNAISKVAAG